MYKHVFPLVRGIGLAGLACGVTSLALAADTLPIKTTSGTASPAPLPPPPLHQSAQEPLAGPGSGVPKQIPAKLHFTAPVQGDYLTQGDTLTIRWGRQGNIGEDCFQLFLFKGISHVAVLTNQWAHSYYQWTVPANLSGSGYKFRLRTCNQNHHAESTGFPILSSKPDLMVAEHSVTPQNSAIPGGDMRVRFRARIDNIGRGSAGASTAFLEVRPTKGCAQILQQSFPIPALVFAGHHSISKDLTLVCAGPWTYRMIADSANQIQEAAESSSAEPSTSSGSSGGTITIPAPSPLPSQTDQALGNNLAVGSYTVPELPDFTIPRLFKDPDEQYINQTVSIHGAVCNDGTVAARNVKLSVTCSKCNMGVASGSSHLVHSKTIPFLPPGSTSEFRFGFKWPCAGTMTCRAKMDSDNTLQEFREDNNERTIKVRVKLL